MKLAQVQWPKPTDSDFMEKLLERIRKRDEEIRKVVNANDKDNATQMAAWLGW